MPAWLSSDRTLIIGHRGAAASAPENTLAAFRLAIEQGADGVEFDVRRTHDGHLVVIHDATVERVAGDAGEIAEMSLAEIGRVDAGVRVAPRFAGERIPTLEDVLLLARGRLLVDIEIKVAGIEGQVLELVRGLGMEDSVLITSFLEDVVAAVLREAPEMAAGLLQQWPDVERAKKYGAPVYLPNVRALTAELMAACRTAGWRVIPWTARSEDEARRALALGVHGIIADDPQLVRAVLDRAAH